MHILPEINYMLAKRSIRNNTLLGFAPRSLVATLFVLFISFAAAHAQTGQKSKVTAVRVFPQGAGVTRVASVNLAAGEQTIRFTGIPANIQPNTIRVSTDNNGVSVFNTVYAPDSALVYTHTPEYRQWEKSVDSINSAIRLINNLVTTLSQELRLLQSNFTLPPTDKGNFVETLEEAADFYRARAQDILNRIDRANDRLKELKVLQGRINTRFQAIAKRERSLGYTLDLSVDVASAGKATFTIDYFTGMAGWVSSYDLNAKNLNSPMHIVLEAQAYQSTGEDWSNISLILETTTPTMTMAPPALAPVFARYKEEIRPAKQRNAARYKDDALAPQYELSTSEGEAYTTARQTERSISISYDLGARQFLASGSAPRRFKLQESDLPANYIHRTVPKSGQDAFLTAELTTYENVLQVDGEATIRLEGAYAGKTFLTPSAAEDTLRVNLGKDPGVGVKYALMKDQTKRKFIDGKQELTRGYEITIKNNKNTEITIDVLDQIPLSTDESMTIKLQKSDGADLDAKTGILRWQLKLKPGESVKKDFQYNIRYPKGRILDLQGF